MILVPLYPNSTYILQSLDVAVFGPLKSRWKKIVKQRVCKKKRKYLNLMYQQLYPKIFMTKK